LPNEFSVFGKMLRAMGQTGHHQVDCSRVMGRQWQMSDRRHEPATNLAAREWQWYIRNVERGVTLICDYRTTV